ncbi:MAG: hypothetical protein Q9184_001295 [Pyrenodesmia sp. 2 TL-2023]
MIASLISGTLLILFLTIYLALAVSRSTQSTDFHVAMIVFVLVLTMAFCHSVIRLSMLGVRLRARERHFGIRQCNMADDEDYAQPETPIPVILARDEELGLHDSANASDNDSIRPVQPPPPAYGLWRSSVVSAREPDNAVEFVLSISPANASTSGISLVIDAFGSEESQLLQADSVGEYE